jgi:hypothetical protein
MVIKMPVFENLEKVNKYTKSSLGCTACSLAMYDLCQQVIQLAVSPTTCPNCADTRMQHPGRAQLALFSVLCNAKSWFAASNTVMPKPLP